MMIKKKWAIALSLMMGALALCAGCLSTADTGKALADKPAQTLDEQVDTIVESMTLPEKVGQMVMIGIYGTDVNDDSLFMLHQYHIGNIILFDRNLESAEQTKALTDHLREQAEQKVPLFIGIDEEGGAVVRGKAFITPPPSQQEIGASGDVTKAEGWADRTAQQLKNLGINVNFAPVADLGGTRGRSYGQDPESVTKFLAAAAQGYEKNRVMYALKHFPGIGRGTVDTHLDVSTVMASREELMQNDVVPFKGIISSRSEEDYFILVGHLKYLAFDPERPASQSPAIVTDLLRKELGYDGIIITDDLNMGAVAKYSSPRERGIQSVKAGVDMIMMCHEYSYATDAYLGILEAVENGEISQQRIDESVKRIVKAKLLHQGKE
ncbi:glycoside hydrolase family 3 protein [Selenomonas sp. ND2010]|uniref:glycoside hydrolase family 3 protein n=1 Tax=Selenomonas sp. ND2010 TaxID=1410618 RepID=UPI00051B73B3|nr:glycoside hydrolase family 3 N-terminal domain-containing protein [Selenomonas sp. ND2010]